MPAQVQEIQRKDVFNRHEIENMVRSPQDFLHFVLVS